MNSDQRIEAVKSYIDDLVERNTNFSLDGTYLCPVCNNSLSVQVERYQRNARKIFGVIVECKECDVTMAIDYRVSEQ